MPVAFYFAHKLAVINKIVDENIRICYTVGTRTTY